MSFIQRLFKMGPRRFFSEYFLKNKSSKQTIIKNFSWLFFGKAISGSLSFVIIILIARYLDVKSYGQFSFAMAFTALFAVAADFGVSSIAFRDLSRDKSDSSSFVSNAIMLKVILGFVTLFLVLVSVAVMGKPFLVSVVVMLFGIDVVLSNFISFFNSIYQAYEKMEFVARGGLIRSAILFSSVVAVFVFRQGMVFIALCYVLSDLATVIVHSSFFRKRFFAISRVFDYKKIKYILRESWPLALGTIFVSIYVRIDSVMLSFIRGDSAVGIYSAAYNLLFAFQSVLGIVHTSIFPRMSQMIHNKEYARYKRFLSLVIRKSLVVLIPLLVVLSLFSRQILTFVYGPKYAVGSTAFTILMWVGFVGFFSTLFGNYLILSNRQRFWTLVVGIGAFVNVIFNFLLIYPFGYVGAAISTLMTEIVVFVILYRIYNRHFHFKKNHS